MYLVTGARGNIGAELVRALAGAGEPVRAMFRGDAPSDLPVGVEAAQGDLDQPASLGPALAGVEGVFLLPGNDDMAGVLSEASRAGVQRVVQLSGSSAQMADETNAVTAYMMRSEQAVRDCGLAWTILRPYAFMSNALRWLPELKAGSVVKEPFPDVRVAVVDPYDIAAVAAAALRTPDHEGKTYVLSGPETRLPAERLHILGDVLGRSLQLDPLTHEAARELMSSQMPPMYVDAMFDFYVDASLDESQVQPTVAQVLSRGPRTFVEWAQLHADDFR